MIMISLLAAIAGLCAGSFLNVVVFRLPNAIMTGEPLNLSGPRSACPDCRTTIAWYDNIPLLSWCMLRAHCRHCKKPVSIRYPLTELVSGLTCMSLSWVLPADYTLVASALFCLILIALAQIDIRFQLLPDALTYLLLWAGLLGSAAGIIPVNLSDAVTGAAAGYLSLWLIREGFARMRKKEGLGLGDAKLLAALGAWTGPGYLPQLLLIASAGGLVYLLFSNMIAGRDTKAPLAFGPFLSVGGAGIYFFTLNNYFTV